MAAAKTLKAPAYNPVARATTKNTSPLPVKAYNAGTATRAALATSRSVVTGFLAGLFGK